MFQDKAWHLKKSKIEQAVYEEKHNTAISFMYETIQRI